MPAKRVALAVLLGCLCWPAAQPLDTFAATGSRAAAPAIARLSNLRTETRWAYPLATATIRATPSPDAAAVGRLRFLSVDAQAELYVALAEAKLPSGQRWVQIEVPGRPNGRRGWVPRAALGTLHVVDEYLRVDEQRLRVTLYRDGHAIFSAPVGIGKPGTVTPTGHFYVLEKLITRGAPAYGPVALGTSAYAPTLREWPGGGVVGIHGTNEPQLIPGRPSHGCVRMRDADIARLFSLVTLGTPIDIV
jgi:L,D-transpeptidase-like protein